MDNISIRDDGPVRIIAFDRPEKGHAITRGMAEGMQRAMQDFDASDQRVAVITATGTRAFSFGADVGEPPDMWRAVPTVGFTTTKPVIAAVEGWCVGGAMVTAIMCDLIVCGAGAKFYYPEAKLGITGGMIAGLAARIPHKVAMEIMLLCRTIEAPRAAAVGLVNEVVPEGEATARAIELGKELAGFAPMVLGALKSMVNDAILPRGPAEQAAMHLARVAVMRGSEDFAEGKAAFREKRPPHFENR
ncbi:enoyl-CoA hydratase/isomerase family protein [Humitalea sp. 24SJ18S-53]|uniref:enoyl-CoA hydratase/isomerase family protein n=1 Tax=Humitalea sp. 24SJ18S-53 TaxID=3422307 RepID=UPI003D6674D9